MGERLRKGLGVKRRLLGNNERELEDCEKREREKRVCVEKQERKFEEDAERKEKKGMGRHGEYMWMKEVEIKISWLHDNGIDDMNT